MARSFFSTPAIFVPPTPLHLPPNPRAPHFPRILQPIYPPSSFCFASLLLFLLHPRLTHRIFIHKTLSSDVHSLQKQAIFVLTCSSPYRFIPSSPVFRNLHKSIKMQFSIATLAVLATAVMAESTLYVTEEVTITSCGPTVTVSCIESAN